MRILVTGSTGFIGRAFCHQAADHEIIVRRALRASHPAEPPFEDAIAGEFSDNPSWDNALTDVDAVVHLAARVHQMKEVLEDSLAAYRQINVIATQQLALSALRAGVKRFVFISSVKVNGEKTPPDAPYTVQMPPHPVDPYGISKWEAEQMLWDLAKEHGLQVTIIRPVLVYGPHVKANFLAMMRWLSWGIPLPLANIHNRRSLVALDNLVDLILTCTQDERAVGHTFFASDDEALSTTELLYRLASALKVPARLFPFPEILLRGTTRIMGREHMVDRLYGSLTVDHQPAHELLGWQPAISVDEGLRRVVDWFRQEQ